MYFSQYQTFNRNHFSNTASLYSFQKTTDRTKKKGVKGQTADLLRLCHTVPLEVVNLGGLLMYLLVYY